MLFLQLHFLYIFNLESYGFQSSTKARFTTIIQFYYIFIKRYFLTLLIVFPLKDLVSVMYITTTTIVNKMGEGREKVLIVVLVHSPVVDDCWPRLNLTSRYQTTLRFVSTFILKPSSLNNFVYVIFSTIFSLHVFQIENVSSFSLS